MVAVVSDGAGSALHAEIGSRTVCLMFLKACRSFLARSSLSSLSEDDVWDWIDGIREAVNIKAKAYNALPRDFAATLVAVLAGPEVSVVVHVGDGAVVLKHAGTQEWIVPSWPFQGEYASTTAFVTDDPQPRLVVTAVEGIVEEFALFSDGIERLVLDHVSKLPHQPFFNRMLAPLKTSRALSLDRDLSSALQSYLATPAICERTDDDKSLVLGLRL